MVKSFFFFLFKAKGRGYAINTSEEIKFVKDIATATGVILDPVYRLVSIVFLIFLLAPNSTWEDESFCFGFLFLVAGRPLMDC